MNSETARYAGRYICLPVAAINDWPCRSETEIKAPADKLAEKQVLPRWSSEFLAEEQLQRRLLHRHLNKQDLVEARQITRNATKDLLRISENENR